MWIYLESARFEGIMKITGIEANYRGEYSYTKIFYGKDADVTEFNNENDCKTFFNKLRADLANPNKILQYGQITDL